MYSIKHITTEGLAHIALHSPAQDSTALLCLAEGGRLRQFIFNDTTIIANETSQGYAQNYASAILFPFANRIKDGTYTYNNVQYVLDCNDIDNNNALHGFVYNKVFRCIDESFDAEHASVTLEYDYDGRIEGFPFKFNIQLVYTLNKRGIKLSVTTVNTGNTSFPFTLGWHPYFTSSNLKQSRLHFNSDIQYTYDDQQILSGSVPLELDMPFQLDGMVLDDGYPLQSPSVGFTTPRYAMEMHCTSQENYLQLYTPKQPVSIAIEPMTGAANNFNNTIGLQQLNPNQAYQTAWHITINTQHNHMNLLTHTLCNS